MRPTPNLAAEKHRIRTGSMATSRHDGNNGAFAIGPLRVIVSDGAGWDHVSVSRADHCPSWEEMCRVKGLFFSELECVWEYHPPRAVYINDHPFTLHLWRKQDFDMPLPDPFLVGLSGAAK